MKKFLYILPLLIVGFISCQSEISNIDETDIFSINVENLCGVERDIMINILSSRYDGYRKGQPATYYPYSSKWNAGGYIFNLSHRIFKRDGIN